jgi:murein DD-endopeptidase MepM/ murein hydrolase activator NlpD
LSKSADFYFNSYYGISNFVDQDNSSGLLDYECNSRTYNGHKGTDYFTWPFPWYIYENNFVEVVAAEGGIIVSWYDDRADDHCSCQGYWNAIYVQHSDGSQTWYGHLKKNSLTSKHLGDSVEKGEYLGIVASSGCSTAPHLHFEVYDNNNNLIDPYSGSCNFLNSTSWWTS